MTQKKPNFYTKLKKTYIDYDYLDKLSVEERKWLRAFTEEYYLGNMTHEILGENVTLHNVDDHDCHTLNNQRNRCQYAKAQSAHHLLSHKEEIINKAIPLMVNTSENALVEILDFIYKDDEK